MLSSILFLLLSFNVFAQVEAPVNPVDYEQNPPHLQWRKIDTEHFELIFPKEIEEDAQRVAHLLEKAYPFVAKSQGVLPPKIPLVLQNQSVISNGFVTLAPRRSEWYVTPAIDPELTNTEWLKTLAIHEFRHVVQFHKSRRGFNRFLEIVLGEIGQALGLALTAPPWYYEGDAVGIETALTNGGRGRLPLFERDLRAILLSGKNYDYDKAHLRSYHDFVPNHYVYGYFLTSHMRNTYGDLFLSKLINESAERSYNPLTFYNSAERLTNRSFEDIYADTMKELLTQWKAKMEKLTPTPYEVKNPTKRFGWTNYLYPQYTKDGKLFALKKGLSFYDRFVVTDGKKEEIVFYPAPLVNEHPFKLRNDRIAFTEYDIDPRWGYRDFTRLRVFDLKEKRVIFDVPETKWRLAVLNHTGTKILLTEWDEKQGQSVLTLNLKGKVLTRAVVPKSEVVTSLDWLNDEEAVVVIKDRRDQKGIERLTLQTGERSSLTARSNVNYGFVTAHEGRILVESPESGIDNIYLVHEGSTRPITTSLFGAYAPVIHQDRLIYNDYTLEGMNIVKKELPWDEVQSSSDSFVPVYEKFARSEGKDEYAAKLGEVTTHEVKPYSQLKNAINPHSWIILAPPLSSSIVLEAFSRDVLNKFSLSVGGLYNLNEQTAQGFVTAAWQHLYPVFDIRGAYGSRKQEFDLGDRKVEDKWEEGTFEAGVQVPWKFIRGRFSHSFTARAFAKLIKVTNKLSDDNTEISDGALYSPGGDLTYNTFSQMAYRDLNPEWGFMLRGHLESGRDVSGEDLRGEIKSVDSRFFLPGLWYHHSFYHQLAYERQRDDTYQYSSFIFYPRGTKSTFLQEFRKYSANYTLPLFYPDWHWSRYFFVKRIFANLFYDELNGHYRSFEYHAASYGWEMNFETHLVRLLLPITWGVRGSYVLDGAERDENYELFINSVLASF